LVLDAYGRQCAVTRERALPALDAAHIRSYSERPEHDVTNGLLLRSDVHRLFDALEPRPDVVFVRVQLRRPLPPRLRKRLIRRPIHVVVDRLPAHAQPAGDLRRLHALLEQLFDLHGRLP